MKVAFRASRVFVTSSSASVIQPLISCSSSFFLGLLQIHRVLPLGGSTLCTGISCVKADQAGERGGG